MCDISGSIRRIVDVPYFRVLCRGCFPNFIRRMKFSLMKQSVAPESTSALMLAIALLVLIEMGTCIDRNCIVTITELNLWTALTQADGFRHFENPLFQRGPSLLVLVHLPQWWPLLEATCWLVAAGFECLIMLLSLVPRHRRFYRQPLLHILDFDVESSFIGSYLVCSTYAGGNCDSNVPFCGKCNTQLHINLFVFSLLDSPV